MVRILTKQLNDLSARWRLFGTMLNLSPATLDTINAAPSKPTVMEKFMSMLEHWIKNDKKQERTWGFLAEAVEDAGYGAVAGKIQNLKDYSKNSKVLLSAGALLDLLKDLAPDWQRLADNLHIPRRISDSIAEKLTVYNCLVRTITEWVMNSRNATFEVLIRAIESDAVDNCVLAISISENVNVLQLLKAPDDDEEIQKELKKHIEQLEGKMDAEVANLPKASSHNPALGTAEEPMETD